MATWNLDATDKLDFSDKEKTIQFFENDLLYAEQYLAYLTRMKARKFPVPQKFLTLAKSDVEDSKKNLALIKQKLGIK